MITYTHKIDAARVANAHERLHPNERATVVDVSEDKRGPITGPYTIELQAKDTGHKLRGWA